MAIECYEDTCEFHCTQLKTDEGPWCHEEECKYNKIEMETKNDNPRTDSISNLFSRNLNCG